MTVPDPTAPTVEDVIARAIHEAECGCGDYEPHDDDEWYPRDAAAVMAAIRGMTVEQVGEMAPGVLGDVWHAGWSAGCDDQQYGDESAQPWTPNPWRAEP